MSYPDQRLLQRLRGNAMAFGASFPWRRQFRRRAIAGDHWPAARRRLRVKSCRHSRRRTKLCRIPAASFAFCGACILTVSGMAQAQSTPEPASGPLTTEKVAAVSGNPAAATFSTGTSCRPNAGLRASGASVGRRLAGGHQHRGRRRHPEGRLTSNEPLLVGLGIDAEKPPGKARRSASSSFSSMLAIPTARPAAYRAITASSVRRPSIARNSTRPGMRRK